MKIVKLAALALALILSLSAVACTVEDPNATSPESTPEKTPVGSPTESSPDESPSETPNESPSDSSPESTPEESKPDEIEYPEQPKFDYMSMDLSKYMNVGQYKDLQISVPKKKVVDEAYIMDILTSDLIYYGQFDKITDRAVTKEDTVSISYVGLLDGVAFEGGTGDADNFTIYDGGGFIDGFADGLIGAMPGKEVDVNVVFPENYHSADLAGKPAVFKVTVHHICEAKELTDEVANEMTGGQYKTAEALYIYYRDYLVEYEEELFNKAKSEATWKAIRQGLTNVSIPEDMVAELYNYEMWWVEYYAEGYGVDIETLLASNGYTRESLRQEMYDNVLYDMMIYSIIKAEQLTLSDDEYKSYVEDSGYTEEQLLDEYTKDELVSIFLNQKLYSEIVEWQTFTETDE